MRRVVRIRLARLLYPSSTRISCTITTASRFTNHDHYPQRKQVSQNVETSCTELLSSPSSSCTASNRAQFQFCNQFGRFSIAQLVFLLLFCNLLISGECLFVYQLTAANFSIVIIICCNYILLQTGYHALKISPKPCNNALGEEGTCMFVWECIKTDGKHLGTCVDGFLFGSCCGHNDTSNEIGGHIHHQQASSTTGQHATNVWMSSSSKPPAPASSSSSSFPSTIVDYPPPSWSDYGHPSSIGGGGTTNSIWPITERPITSPFDSIFDPSSSSLDDEVTVIVTASGSAVPTTTTTPRPTTTTTKPTTTTTSPSVVVTSSSHSPPSSSAVWKPWNQVSSSSSPLQSGGSGSSTAINGKLTG